MDGVRRLGSIVPALAAGLATVLAVAWRAAEEGRGLDVADLRSVAIVAAIVLATAAWLGRRVDDGSDPGPNDEPDAT